jgi:hypothetical protein
MASCVARTRTRHARIRVADQVKKFWAPGARAAIVSVAYGFFVIGILDILSVDDQSSGDDD